MYTVFGYRNADSAPVVRIEGVPDLKLAAAIAELLTGDYDRAMAVMWMAGHEQLGISHYECSRLDLDRVPY